MTRKRKGWNFRQLASHIRPEVLAGLPPEQCKRFGEPVTTATKPHDSQGLGDPGPDLSGNLSGVRGAKR